MLPRVIPIPQERLQRIRIRVQMRLDPRVVVAQSERPVLPCVQAPVLAAVSPARGEVQASTTDAVVVVHVEWVGVAVCLGVEAVVGSCVRGGEVPKVGVCGAGVVHGEGGAV